MQLLLYKVIVFLSLLNLFLMPHTSLSMLQGLRIGQSIVDIFRFIVVAEGRIRPCGAVVVGGVVEAVEVFAAAHVDPAILLVATRLSHEDRLCCAFSGCERVEIPRVELSGHARMLIGIGSTVLGEADPLAACPEVTDLLTCIDLVSLLLDLPQPGGFFCLDEQLWASDKLLLVGDGGGEGVVASGALGRHGEVLALVPAAAGRGDRRALHFRGRA